MIIDKNSEINILKILVRISITVKGDWAFGVALTRIQTVSEVMSLDVTWWPNLEWPGSEIFTCAEIYINRYTKNGGAERSLRKTWRGCSNTTRARHGLTLFLAGSESIGIGREGPFRPPLQISKPRIVATNGKRRLIVCWKNYNFCEKRVWVRSILRSPEVITNNMICNILDGST